MQFEKIDWPSGFPDPDSGFLDSPIGFLNLYNGFLDSLSGFLGANVGFLDSHIGFLDSHGEFRDLNSEFTELDIEFLKTLLGIFGKLKRGFEIRLRKFDSISNILFDIQTKQEMNRNERNSADMEKSDIIALFLK